MFMKRLAILVPLVSGTIGLTAPSDASASAADAFEFVVTGDHRDPLIKRISFDRCISAVTVDSILLGLITVTHDWNEAIWNSKDYRVNENGNIELSISCRNQCARYAGEDGIEAMLALGALMGGIDLSSTISFEISASQRRVDRALEDLKLECPGVKSRY